MSELISAMTAEQYESAKMWAERLMVKKGIAKCDLWEYLGGFIKRARSEYAKRFVVWQRKHHMVEAQRELADRLIFDLEFEG